jgi:hypothetical protein
MCHGATASPLALLLAEELERGRVLGYGLLAAGALLVGAFIVAVANRWRRRGDERPSASDQLAQFRSLYDQGHMSKEEFDRIRARLGGQLREEMALPPGAGKAPPPPDGPRLPEAPPAPDRPAPDDAGPAK